MYAMSPLAKLTRQNHCAHLATIYWLYWWLGELLGQNCTNIELKMGPSELERTKILSCIFCSQVMATLLDQRQFWTGKGLLLTRVPRLVSHFRPRHTQECGDPDMDLAVAQLDRVQVLSEVRSTLGLQWLRAAGRVALVVDRRLPGDRLCMGHHSYRTAPKWWGYLTTMLSHPS